MLPQALLAFRLRACGWYKGQDEQWTGDALRWTRAALGSQLSVDLPGQRPLLPGWQCPQLPHGPRWLPELQNAHQTLGWKK